VIRVHSQETEGARGWDYRLIALLSSSRAACTFCSFFLLFPHSHAPGNRANRSLRFRAIHLRITRFASTNWKLSSLRPDETFLYLRSRHDGHRRSPKSRTIYNPIYSTIVDYSKSQIEHDRDRGGSSRWCANLMTISSLETPDIRCSASRSDDRRNRVNREKAAAVYRVNCAGTKEKKKKRREDKRVATSAIIAIGLRFQRITINQNLEQTGGCT